ncbi:DUF1996 domain-containing protein [Actinosynnema sp. NPDC047251]|uniref:DUF1996 domain-containing protein n=1 Tax=Saccharothrix espanaensis (strain ATCC 51144 / DSM 44229 / JCM 9112 / NBRC 15066 / NRRL 15764) TaxID=1179773 RepID=K0K884_SACES|nr:DUF1996 domain-containing protein [Saccharothrix espanaensis]CCH33737.1 hypothetical protein BN6_64950 [Saccharothrix espanaensis DSM 44229]
MLPLFLVLLLASCGADSRSVAIEDVPLPAPPPALTADASPGTFTVECGRNEQRHLNADNMVIAPGAPFGAHHTHEYVGNLSTDHTSTDRSLAAATTSCAAGDLSTYYWPVLRLTDGVGHDAHAQGGGAHGNTGEVLPPSRVSVTFTGSPVGKVVPMPRFLRMITGDPAALTSGAGTAQWTCAGFEDRHTDRYPECGRSELLRTYDFPHCWDGRNTDSASHRAHVVPAASNGACPKGTFPIPRLRVRVAYQVPLGRPFALDSFPEQLRDPRTDHAMSVNVMPDDLAAEVATCVNEGRTCP